MVIVKVIVGIDKVMMCNTQHHLLSYHFSQVLIMIYCYIMEKYI
jgi:hypothetical protein